MFPLFLFQLLLPLQLRSLLCSLLLPETLKFQLPLPLQFLQPGLFLSVFGILNLFANEFELRNEMRRM
jgi:hypothetical protein